MGWEDRKGRGRYYTRSRRVGGRVVREYVGSGRVAELSADLDILKRNERLVDAAGQKQRVAEDAALDAECERLSRLADLLGRAVLLSSGYHNHRGEWRKRRG